MDARMGKSELEATISAACIFQRRVNRAKLVEMTSPVIPPIDVREQDHFA